MFNAYFNLVMKKKEIVSQLFYKSFIGQKT